MDPSEWNVNQGLPNFYLEVGGLYQNLQVILLIGRFKYALDKALRIIGPVNSFGEVPFTFKPCKFVAVNIIIYKAKFTNAAFSYRDEAHTERGSVVTIKNLHA